MKDQEEKGTTQLPTDLRLVKLTREQIKRIDDLLVQIGEYGELHFIVERGELRYVDKVESYNFWDMAKKKR